MRVNLERKQYETDDEEKIRGVYVDRIAGGDRDHCDSGRTAVAGTRKGEAASPTRELHDQPEADQPGIQPVDE